MKNYGVMTDYDYSEDHKRSRITVWTGPFASVLEAEGLSLPSGAGYMLTTYNNDKVRVACPAPRSIDNYEEVDAAINVAMIEYHRARGDFQLVSA